MTDFLSSPETFSAAMKESHEAIRHMLHVGAANSAALSTNRLLALSDCFGHGGDLVAAATAEAFAELSKKLSDIAFLAEIIEADPAAAALMTMAAIDTATGVDPKTVIETHFGGSAF